MNIITASNITVGTTVLIWAGAEKIKRTVAAVTDTVDRKTMALMEVTIHWTDGTKTNYLPSSEFTAV